jgi:type IV pilus assembly protein PilA
MSQKRVSQRGFTLIELLVVIGIIAILAAIVAIAVNPSRQYGQARDAQRWSDVNALLNAIHQYAADNEGLFPDQANLPAALTLIGDDVGQVDICSFLVTQYLPSMPFDPSTSGAHYTTCADYETGYRIQLSGGRVTIDAPGKEQATAISITR